MNSRFRFKETELLGLYIVQRQVNGDRRGFLSRLFCAEELAAAGWQKSVAQINHTFTARCGTIRGLHYQLPPHTEMKLVSCIRGEVWDMAVDLRATSATFLHVRRLCEEYINFYANCYI
jgi:dTDP-4-dehydrorhamnose 3,5-epimerase